MERFSLRDYTAQDFDGLADFLMRIRPVEQLARYPTPVDLEELFALEQIRIPTCLAVDGEGELAGYALLDPRFCNLFFEVTREQSPGPLEDDLLGWGMARFRQLKAEGIVTAGNTLDTNCDEADLSRVVLLERHGFVSQDLLTLHFERSLDEPIPPVSLPAGFSLRAVAGEQEVDAIVDLYHAAYGTETTTREDVLAILKGSNYERDLDLLAVAADGRLAGLCSCVIDHALNRFLPQRSGWTDPVLVHPDFQGRGLAGALIHRGWQLLRERGVAVACLGTSSRNEKAIAAFNRAGYREVSRRRWYSKKIDP